MNYPYQNYQPNMFQYQNPVYGQQQLQNPYMDRLNQLQAMQQNLQQPQQQQFMGINGKVVENLESIMANDVPMDVPFAVFPKKDLSEVYIKYWTGEGKIATIVFKPNMEQNMINQNNSQDNSRFEQINNALSGIYEKVDGLTNRVEEVLKSKNNFRNKKEITDE